MVRVVVATVEVERVERMEVMGEADSEVEMEEVGSVVVMEVVDLVVDSVVGTVAVDLEEDVVD